MGCIITSRHYQWNTRALVDTPLVDSIEIKRKGKVRRAKLYYLRERRGKSARIAERTTGRGVDQTRGKK